PQELSSKARKAFDVAALPLGEQRVEGERTLAAAANAGQADQLVARQNNVDILQIVFASAANHDIGSRHIESKGGGNATSSVVRQTTGTDANKPIHPNSRR